MYSNCHSASKLISITFSVNEKRRCQSSFANPQTCLFVYLFVCVFVYRYRAPECLLTDGYYTHKMDMWSVGCVFFEVLR